MTQEEISTSAPTMVDERGISIDFKQATELLAMFGGEPAEITLLCGPGHSGDGLYAYYTDLPEEGAEFLGVTDDEARPDADGATENNPSPSQDAGDYASATGAASRIGANQHHEHRVGQADDQRASAERDSGGAGVSGEGQVREAVAESIRPTLQSLGGDAGVSEIPLTCKHSGRSDCGLFGMGESASSFPLKKERPSREWYAAKIQETLNEDFVIGAERFNPDECDRPPEGWRCTREKGHEGPCAALSLTSTEKSDGWLPIETVAEWPDAGELEAWRSAADELLQLQFPHKPTIRRAAMLLQNAYLFASKCAPKAAEKIGRSE